MLLQFFRNKLCNLIDSSAKLYLKFGLHWRLSFKSKKIKIESVTLINLYRSFTLIKQLANLYWIKTICWLKSWYQGSKRQGFYTTLDFYRFNSWSQNIKWEWTITAETPKLRQNFNRILSSKALAQTTICLKFASFIRVGLRLLTKRETGARL